MVNINRNDSINDWGIVSILVRVLIIVLVFFLICWMNTFKGKKCEKKKKPHTLPIITKRVVFFLLQVIGILFLNAFDKKKVKKKRYKGSVRQKKFADILKIKIPEIIIFLTIYKYYPINHYHFFITIV